MDNIVSHVIEQGIFQNAYDLFKLNIIDWNRLYSWANPADACESMSSWFQGVALYTIIHHDLKQAPEYLWPGWKHAGAHEILGRIFWNDFHWRHHGTLFFSDEPDFSGTLHRHDGKVSQFWGDIGICSAQTFALAQRQMGAHDLWISIPNDRTQIIIEPLISIREAWEHAIGKYVPGWEEDATIKRKYHKKPTHPPAMSLWS